MSLKVKVKVCEEKDEAPILCCFPGGQPPVISDDDDSLRFSLHAHKDAASGGRKARQKVLCAETEAMSYKGKNFGSATTLTPQYAVGLAKEEEDSNSVTVKLLPVSYAIFQLGQTLKGKEDESSSEEEAEEGGEGYLLKRKLLAETFGSRKRQRMIRSQLANQIEIDNNVSQGALTNVLTTDIQDMPEEDKPGSVNDLLPAHDAETTDAGKIYELHVIFDAELVRSLEVKDLMNKKPGEKSCSFVKYAVPRVPKTDKKKLKNACRALLYLDYCVLFNNVSPRKKSESLNKLTFIPDIVKAELLGGFTVNQMRNKKLEEVFTSSMKQKLLCWVAVLSLLGCNGVIDADGLKCLAADLKMTVAKLLVYFKQVGCMIASKKQCVLTAPLTQPELRLPKAKNK